MNRTGASCYPPFTYAGFPAPRIDGEVGLRSASIRLYHRTGRGRRPQVRFMTRATQLTDEGLSEQVRRFYAKVRLDDELGPVFEAAIDDWEPHLERITTFWQATMLGRSRYRGDVPALHKPHPITPPMFDRWLRLWGETADELFAPEPADQLRQRAARIAESLKLALFFRV
jgi:hemoglobin